MSRRESLGVVAAVLLGTGAIALLGPQSFPALVIMLGAVNVIAVLGLNIPVGFTRVLSIGQAGAFALGAYVSAITSVEYGWPWWLGVVLAIMIGFASGLLLGLAALRVTDLIGLAMMTLGFAVLVGDLAIGWNDLTRGFSGIAGVTAHWWFDGGGTLSQLHLGGVILVVTGLAYWFHAAFRRHRIGLSSMAVGQSEIGAVAIGIDATRLKMLSLGLANMLGAVGGALFVYVYAFVSPGSISIWVSVTLLLMVILGGAGSRVGPVLGGFVLTALPLYLSVELHIEGLQPFLYGSLVVLMIRLLPDGLVSKVSLPSLGPEVGSASEGTEDLHLEVLDADVPPSGTEDRTGPLLELRGVAIRFGGVRALDGVDVTVDSGEVVGLVGANGSGKTTLLNLASGYYAPTEGEVIVSGHRLKRADARLAAQHGIGRTFQTPNTFGRLSVAEHLALGRQHPPTGGSPARQDFFADLGERILARCCGPDVADKDARSLSHGQLRFLEIAMAVSRAPHVLLLDEPAAGLSPAEIERLGEVVRAIAALDVGLVLVEHHLEFVRGLVDRVVVLDRGSVLWAGNPEELSQQADVQRVFLGGRRATPAVETGP
ncbi:ATP-binding cassette domain-containing protein [Euzebya sp.]|uniref:branched-chain amino acid ABC transporter ATP-binding protein/permease n=1 Tax=Euzebya sp. TaxID=1971409 RepID=UPI0035137C18